MIEYFPFVFIMNQKEYYCIWYSNEKDGFLTESNKIMYFDRFEQLYSYSNSNNLKIEEGKTVLLMDNAIKWLQEEKKEIDCIYFLDYWNAISDLANSVGEHFYGDEDKSIIHSIYDKLFYGNNLQTIKRDGETFLPEWKKKEVNELAEVVKDGLRIVNMYLLD